MLPSAQLPRADENIDGFISYSHFDKAWVDSLHARLADRLAEQLGEKPNIWRDTRMGRSEAFAHTLVLKLSKTAFLISVLSPGYINSEWCIKELNEFYRYATESGGIRINNKSRVFKIVKSPIEDFDVPPILQELLEDFLGYEFYEIDKFSGKPREYRPELGSDSLVKFLERLEDLVYDIRDFIKSQKLSRGPELASESSGTTIYLADTAPDLRDERDRIKRELQLHGHTVLPDKVLPLEAVRFESTVREFLAQSQFSVHLVGETRGVLPTGEKERSTVRLQYDLAGAHKNPDFFRLVWMPKKLRASAVSDENHRKFVNDVLRGTSVRKGDELLITKLEDLKTAIEERTNAAAKAPARAAAQPTPAPENVGEAGGNHLTHVYLICKGQDLEAAAPLKQYLFDKGFEVMLPLEDGDVAEIIKDHNEKLSYCDAALVYFGRGGENWVREQLKQIQKSAASRQSGPLLAKAVYSAFDEAPGADASKANSKAGAKENFQTHAALVIKNYGPFSPEPLEPFLALAQGTGGGGK
ncbi:MAG TPA: toll/interleukin-1 receptor domain-containing protein [Pyrinomonadaceae bacterium]|nr:toll/interleukin-1 receptor domain-containing protein [Pyrinomonadaceae bacterium]